MSFPVFLLTTFGFVSIREPPKMGGFFRFLFELNQKQVCSQKAAGLLQVSEGPTDSARRGREEVAFAGTGPEATQVSHQKG